MRVKGYENGFRLTLLPYRLEEPLNRTKPTVYFVNSMSDLFHEGYPDDYIRQVFDVIRQSSATYLSSAHKKGRTDGGLFPEL